MKGSTSQGMPVRIWSYLRGSSAPYMMAIGITVPAALLASYLFGPGPVIKGQPWWIFLAFLGTGIAFLLWLVYRRSLKPSKLFALFILLDVLAWIVITIQSKADGVPENHTTYLAPLIMLMILLKPPNLKGAFAGGDVFAFTLIAISVVSHLAAVTGQFPFPHAAEHPTRLPEWLHSGELVRNLGLDSRWEGPFGSTSDAAPVGAFLFMYALLRRGWTRWLCISAGLLICVASLAWTSIAGIALALLVLLWCKPGYGRIQFSRAVRTWVTLITLSLGLLFVAIKDPTFDGRTIIWAEYLRAWVHYPITGLGGSGITAHLDDWFSNGQGHNFYIDTLLRYGLVGLSVTVGTIVLSGVLSWRAMRAGLPEILAAFVAFAVILIGETLILWRYFTIVSLELLLIGAIASAYLARSESSTVEASS